MLKCANQRRFHNEEVVRFQIFIFPVANVGGASNNSLNSFSEKIEAISK